MAISTHGCIMPCKENGNELRKAFIAGLPVMLGRLTPKCVVVYGRMPDDIFGPYLNVTKFVHFESDIQGYYDSKKEVRR